MMKSLPIHRLLALICCLVWSIAEASEEDPCIYTSIQFDAPTCSILSVAASPNFAVSEDRMIVFSESKIFRSFDATNWERHWLNVPQGNGTVGYGNGVFVCLTSAAAYFSGDGVAALPFYGPLRVRRLMPLGRLSTLDVNRLPE